jgi:hypothetical protein
VETKHVGNAYIKDMLLKEREGRWVLAEREREGR